MRLFISKLPNWHGMPVKEIAMGYDAGYKLRFRKGGRSTGKPTSIGPSIETYSENGKPLCVLNLSISEDGQITASTHNLSEECVPAADLSADKESSKKEDSKGEK